MKKALIALGLLAVLAAGAAAGLYFYKKNQTRNVHGSSTVEFTPTTTQAAAPKPPPPGIVWPTYGFDNARLRAPGGFKLKPPFRAIWSFRARQLVEFPPAVAYGRLYFSNNSGTFFALRAKTGKLDWHYSSGRCVAATPAVDEHLVYMTFLNKPPCNSSKSPDVLTGEVIAFDAKTGDVRWRKTIGPSESSPLVQGGLVYVGDWRGDVYALGARSGNVVWRFHTGGRVKGAVSAASGRVYVGSYDGHVYALGARNGRRIWRASGQGTFTGSGTFYANPALAYGRLYIGSTDRKVYSFGATSGKLRWSHSAGGYVYSSPAVWNDRVYAGSYGGDFLCFDAATGDLKWRFHANGPISGSPTVLNGVVYFATLKRRTYGLNALTGKQVWTFPDGKYSPVVADADHVYLVGYTKVYAMVEK
jgi:outer membrane protein assembly factor BamB